MMELMCAITSFSKHFMIGDECYRTVVIVACSLRVLGNREAKRSCSIASETEDHVSTKRITGTSCLILCSLNRKQACSHDLICRRGDEGWPCMLAFG
jgi:hypothetical protein